jgi:hypothetical protein
MAPKLNLQHHQGPKRRNPDMYTYLKIKSLKVLGKGALCVAPSGSLWKEMHHLQSQWFIHSFISVGVPKQELSHEKRGKYTVIIHRAPRRRKAYIQWGVAWFL